MLAIWVVFPVYYIIAASNASDIIDGVCGAWSVYSSAAVMNLLCTNSILISYLLPLALMIFCYSRIVYTLRTKVTTDKTVPSVLYCICMAPVRAL